MKSLRYLNSMLTVIAVLLALNIWTLWTVTPGGEATGIAAEVRADGIANAGAQRKQIIDAVNQVRGEVGEIKMMFKNGSARVRLEAGSQQPAQ
ncbi:MAG: hypothetical protein Kow00105_18050 [Phycisphaeraceae bacterium]